MRLVPIYTSRGDVGAYLLYPYLYNLAGEWIGWVTRERQVYSVHGHYVGYLTDDPRILRHRAYDYTQPPCQPPAPPPPIRPPASTPLAPQMPELSLSHLDVLDEDPDLLPSVDAGELRQDLD